MRDRPELKAALRHARKGDSIVVWKLDRLARSLKQLIETVEDLEQRGVGFRSLTEAIDTTTSGGRLVFHIFGGAGRVRARRHPRAHGGRFKSGTGSGLQARAQAGADGQGYRGGQGVAARRFDQRDRCCPTPRRCDEHTLQAHTGGAIGGHARRARRIAARTRRRPSDRRR